MQWSNEVTKEQQQTYRTIRKIRWIENTELSQWLLPYFAKMKVRREWDWKEQRWREIFKEIEGRFVKIDKSFRESSHWPKMQMNLYLLNDAGGRNKIECNVSTVTRQLMNRLATLDKIGKIRFILGMSIWERDRKPHAWISVDVDWEKLSVDKVAISKQEQYEHYADKEVTRKGTNFYWDRFDDKLFELCEKLTNYDLLPKEKVENEQ